MKTTGDYLSGIYTDFIRNVDSMNSLCEMRKLNYSLDELPDYSSTVLQQLYHLRYTYAYTYEYYVMYDHALRLLEPSEQPLSVLSVGCGALTDYAGLRKRLGTGKRKIDYTGIDLIDWKYKAEPDEGDHVVVRTGIRASQYFRDVECLDSDIFMFPKSISEMDDGELSEIAEAFLIKPNLKKRFCLGISLRKNEQNCKRDIIKADKLAANIAGSGYAPLGNPGEYYIFSADKGICAYMRDYKYPDRIIPDLVNMEEKCKMKDRCRYTAECSRCLNKYPILKTDNICYKMYAFERRNAA